MYMILIDLQMRILKCKCSRNLYQSQCESDINGAKVFLECKKIWAKYPPGRNFSQAKTSVRAKCPQGEMSVGAKWPQAETSTRPKWPQAKSPSRRNVQEKRNIVHYLLAMQCQMYQFTPTYKTPPDFIQEFLTLPSLHIKWLLNVFLWRLMFLNHLIIVWLFARLKILLVQSCKTIVNQPIRKDRIMVRMFVLFRMIPDLLIHLPNFEGKLLCLWFWYIFKCASWNMLTQPVSKSMWQWHYWGQGISRM